MKYFTNYLRFCMLPGIIFSLSCMISVTPFAFVLFDIIFLIVFFTAQHKAVTKETFYTLVVMNIVSFLFFTLSFIISKGSLTSSFWLLFCFSNWPYIMFFITGTLIGQILESFMIVLTLNFVSLVLVYFIVKPPIAYQKIIIFLGCLALSIGCDYYFFINSPSQKYKGHDFQYMHGFSSTDLKPYLPYTKDNKLVKLNEKSSFVIEDEKDMPILDGAEACYPVYSAIAQAVYKDIDVIEKKHSQVDPYTNGKIVTFYNTSVGYSHLFNGEVDMFFGAKPSQSQLAEAKEMNVELEYTPIGKEAFVFFVNKHNSINSLKAEEIKQIYHGDITNWKEVGGKDHEIIAFQRPERSGSQSMMNHFMGDVTLKEPLTYEMQSAMEGIIKEVAQYHNEDGALGYTFKYFLEGLHQEKDVKILSIDDVYPTSQTIKDQSYPLSTYLYCVTLKSNKKENVKKLKEYLLSPQGQEIIEKTGYCALQ